ncbi:hypothetical protein AMC85_CH04053 [Rhizobium phaseoli]|nr:hypothetical protein AMC88_CH04056 [Rhizobium phaseoli]ANL61375.1 hypothetical protein AMC85_CH04053 [Rhizobium phaseoli]
MKGDRSLRHRDLLRDEAIERDGHLIERPANTESVINHQMKFGSKRFLAVVNTIRRESNLTRI